MEAWRLSEEDSDSSDSDSDAESVLERCPCKERLSGSSVARAPNEGRAGGLGEVFQKVSESHRASESLRAAPQVELLLSRSNFTGSAWPPRFASCLYIRPGIFISALMCILYAGAPKRGTQGCKRTSNGATREFRPAQLTAKAAALQSVRRATCVQG